MQIHHLMIREREIDQRKFVHEEGNIDDKSDVELDENDQLDLDLDSELNDDNLESDLDLSPIQRMKPALQRIFSDPQFLKKKTGPKLENTNLLHSSPPVDFF